MMDLTPITTLPEHEQEALRALNNEHARETSHLHRPAWEALCDAAFCAVTTPGRDVLLIALTEDADYDSPNFQWFRMRYPLFVYVDRIIVSPNARGRGLAAGLYEHLFATTAAAGKERVVCEVNSDPPNPASDAFHARLRFEVVGTATLSGRGKTVRYMERIVEPYGGAH